MSVNVWLYMAVCAVCESELRSHHLCGSVSCIEGKKACGLTDWRRGKKRVHSALRETYTSAHTHTQIYKYSSTIFVKAGDKHRVFPHRPWLPFLSTEWKQRGSLKKRVQEGENYSSLSLSAYVMKTGRPHSISRDGSAHSDIETWH